MRNTRKSLRAVFVGLALLLLLGGLFARADEILVPEYLWQRHISEKTTPNDIADTHLGIPYRDDGALNSKGRFTTFNRPDQVYSSPGMNCSGLVLSVSRFLLNRNFSLTEVSRDRQKNSGPGSSLGKDWDFGLDLILNITDGVPRRVVMPDGKDYPLENADGTVLRGFDLHDWDAWQRVLSQMKPGYAYYGSISKPSHRPGYRLLHYHVVLMLPDENGNVWLYHSTRRSNVHRMNLKSRRGLNRLMSQFGGSRDDAKKILIVEAVLPRFRPEPASTIAAKSGLLPDAEKKPGAANNHGRETLERLTGLGGPGSDKTQERQLDRTPPGGAQGAQAATVQGPADPNPGASPNLVVNHLSGKVFNEAPELVTHVPRFADEGKTGIKFWFRNRANAPRKLEVLVRAIDGDATYQGTLPPKGTDLEVLYPRDFGATPSGPLKEGRYGVNVKVDGVQWFADLFEVALARDANPRIKRVKVPSTVRSGSTFTVQVEAENDGVESDYGGITVSCPNPSGLRIVSAKPGRVYGPGSTVLSVTSDRIRTKVPMAERWIELWGENKVYDMDLKVRAGSPGTYPLYVRCALRSVNLKGHVILMDPKAGDTVDQQGFPVKVYTITVQ